MTLLAQALRQIGQRSYIIWPAENYFRLLGTDLLTDAQDRIVAVAGQLIIDISTPQLHHGTGHTRQMPW